MKPEPLASSSTTPSTTWSPAGSGRSSPASSSVAPSSPRARGRPRPPRRPRRGRLAASPSTGSGSAPPVGSARLGLAGRLGAGLAGDDGVDQLLLAQTAESVDAELVGEQVKVGERALLQLGPVQDCGHGCAPLGKSVVGWHPAALCAAAGNP